MSLLVKFSAASSATRRSLGVSDSSPLSIRRLGRAPVVEGAVLDLQQLDVVAERAELSDRVIVPALLEPQAPAGELKERQVSVRAQLVGKPALIDAGLRRIEVALLNRELGQERVAV